MVGNSVVCNVQPTGPAEKAIAPVTGDQGRPASLWNHSGSVVGLFADGPSRAFRYERPRVGMQAEGVTKGTLLFDGTKSGDTYDGTAYIFDRRCQPIPYPVSGPVSADDRQVALTGNKPSALDNNCQPTSYQRDVLYFTFIESTASGAVNEQPTGPAGKTTEKHVQQKICTPIIREALSSGAKDQAKRIERSLVAFCEKCFSEQLKKDFSLDELAALDLILADRSTSLATDLIERLQATYNRLFEVCSDRIVKKMAAALAAK